MLTSDKPINADRIESKPTLLLLFTNIHIEFFKDSLLNIIEGIIMKLSQNGVDFIKHFEGFSSDRYKCLSGFTAIGYGHNILEHEKDLVHVTEEEATELLKKDASIAENCVLSKVKVPLEQHQFDALVSFSYNVGIGNFSNSTLLKLLNKGDYAGAADEFLKWVFVKKVKTKGLEKRRESERNLFLTGNYNLNQNSPVETSCELAENDSKKKDEPVVTTTIPASNVKEIKIVTSSPLSPLTNTSVKTSLKNLENDSKSLMDSLQKALAEFSDIPFGNSEYQINHFIIGETSSKTRQYRTIGLQLFGLFKTIGNLYFDIKESSLEIENILNRISSESDPYTKQMLQLKIDRKNFEVLFTTKLLHDAKLECNVYIDLLKKLPELTREQFEAGEKEYFDSLNKNSGNKSCLATQDSMTTNPIQT
jgi:lysozyme